MVEFDAISFVILNNVIVNEMIIRGIQNDAMVSIRNDVVCDDRIPLVYFNDAIVVRFSSVGDGKMAEVDMVCVDGDDGIHPVSVDDRDAPVFSKKVDRIIYCEVLQIGSVVDKNPVTV